MKQVKVAFVLNKMIAGGPQRSFLNLIRLIDIEKYNITLILFNKGGILFENIPSFVSVKYIKPQGLFCTYNENPLSYLGWSFIRIFLKIFSDITIKLFNKPRQIKWKLKSYFIFNQKEFYDFAIAYSEEAPIYYIIEKMNSRIKIGRIPTDYKSANLNYNFDRKYLCKLDYIICVSKENARILTWVFPELVNRIKIIESIIAPAYIRQQSLIGKGFDDNFNGIRILTLSRLDYTKGIDIAINACKMLVEDGYNIKWYVIGAGTNESYNRLLSSMKIVNRFKIISPKNNPYPFIKQADIYVQPSRYEGKSNAVNEAMALYKPIVVTNYHTAKDHIHHMKNGIISNIHPKSLASSLKLLIDNKELMNKFSDFLKNNFEGNEGEIIKLYEIFKDRTI